MSDSDFGSRGELDLQRRVGDLQRALDEARSQLADLGHRVPPHRLNEEAVAAAEAEGARLFLVVAGATPPYDVHECDTEPSGFTSDDLPIFDVLDPAADALKAYHEVGLPVAVPSYCRGYLVTNPSGGPSGETQIVMLTGAPKILSSTQGGWW